MILTSDLTAALTLGVGTKIMSVTHLLITLYLSVKFYQRTGLYKGVFVVPEFFNHLLGTTSHL